MQKPLLSLFLVFMVFGMLFNSPIILADNGDSAVSVTDNSGTGNADDEEERDRVRERTETRIRERDGEIEREFKKEIRTAEGARFKIERKIRIKDGEVEIKTRLKVEGSGANLSVVDSEGERHRIRVTPERLRMLIIERLMADNITDFSIDEVDQRNVPRVVFKVNSEHPGRFLGIFKISLRAQTAVDPETGEILDVNVPWWAFLITGEDISDEIIGNETIEDDLIADDDELEEDFGDVEVDEELEIKAETLNGAAEVKIELEFETETANTEDVVSEVLGKLTLSSEEINGFLEMEESDEALELKDELEFEIDSEDELTEVEFELKFIVASDNREAIVSAIAERLSSLTSESILNALEADDEDNDDLEDELTLNLLQQNDSGESGTAILVEENGEVIVTLSLTGFVPDVSQPAHIHVGSCPDVGAVKYPLTNVLNGESVTTLDVTLAQLESGLPLAINVHQSVENASIYTSCGDIEF